MNMGENKLRVGIITFPLSESGIVPLSNLVHVLCSLSNTIHIVSGSNSIILAENRKDIRVYPINHKKGRNLSTRILNYALTQAKISYELAKLANKVDIFIFFIGGASLLLPMLTSKILGKRVVLAMAGSATQSIQVEKNILSIPIKFMAKLNFALSDRIILYGKNLIEGYGLGKYRNKLSIAHEHFIDFNTFRTEKILAERDDLIGYIGRLSKEKGVTNFVKAIPKVLEARKNARFLIVGQGPLRPDIEEFLSIQNLNDKVSLLSWIPHEEIPKYLNELRLIVLPSYTEGLANIVLEAMACGTPVLATPVGAVPDIIKDGETGFIMENNSPECIARNIIRALNHPNPEQIAQNARALVENKFTYEKAVEGYRNILGSILK